MKCKCGNEIRNTEELYCYEYSPDVYRCPKCGKVYEITDLAEEIEKKDKKITELKLWVQEGKDIKEMNVKYIEQLKEEIKSVIEVIFGVMSTRCENHRRKKHCDYYIGEQNEYDCTISDCPLLQQR